MYVLADWQATTKSKNHFFLFSTKTLVASKPYQGVDLMTKHGGGLERFVCSKPHKKLYILRSHLPKNSTRPLASQLDPLNKFCIIGLDCSFKQMR